MNITKININNKEIILLPTAHVSKKSYEEVIELCEQENPTSICVELDEDRYNSIINPKKWEEEDIIKIIKEKKAGFMLANLILSNYQKKIAKKFGIVPGQEMIEGINQAKQRNIPLILADRKIQITFSRIWHSQSTLDKIKLLSTIISSFFSDEDVKVDDVEKLKQEDMLQNAILEISQAFPNLAQTLIFERDQYLAQKIKNAPGNKVVAILGAAHVNGVIKELENEHDLKALNAVIKKNSISKYLMWLIPLAIIFMIISTFSIDPNVGKNQIISWILWNGGLSALGTLLVLGHPLSALMAFIFAPITSLNPLLAAGWFAGLTEAYIRKPKIKDFENLSESLNSVKGILTNRITKILLVVISANIFSSIATYISGIGIFKDFFQTFF